MKQKFTAVIKKDGVNSQGKTKAELVKNLRSALSEVLKFNRADARRAAENDYEEASILV